MAGSVGAENTISVLQNFRLFVFTDANDQSEPSSDDSRDAKGQPLL